MRKHIYIILWVILLGLLFVNKSFGQTNKINERKQLITSLNNSKELPVETVLAALDSADIFVQKEDTLVLSALFNLTFKSDGAVSELLGTILGELFLHKTDFFLNTLLKRNEEQQKHIAAMAFYMDGSGMLPDYLNNIELKLREVKKRKEIKFVKLANLCLSVMYEVKKEVNN